MDAVWAEGKYDLLILDVSLPDGSGFEICEKVRQTSKVPIIFLTASDEEVNIIMGLDMGGDDYITKPFEIDELLARIIVQFRKTSTKESTKILKYRNITVNLSTHIVQVDSQNVKLTKTEFAILKLLMENPNQIITKTVLLERISEDTPDCMESSLRVHISNLRKKLRDISGKDYIESVWGIGFKMAEA